jgi:hypothetical protein
MQEFNGTTIFMTPAFSFLILKISSASIERRPRQCEVQLKTYCAEQDPLFHNFQLDWSSFYLPKLKPIHLRVLLTYRASKMYSEFCAVIMLSID